MPTINGVCIICGRRSKTEIPKQRKHRKTRKEKFFELMDAVWHHDIKGIVGILAKNKKLVNYRGFTFHLPQKSNSLLEYAQELGKETTIVQVLLGFGAS